jgi:hypothetical protein
MLAIQYSVKYALFAAIAAAAMWIGNRCLSSSGPTTKAAITLPTTPSLTQSDTQPINLDDYQISDRGLVTSDGRIISLKDLELKFRGEPHHLPAGTFDVSSNKWQEVLVGATIVGKMDGCEFEKLCAVNTTTPHLKSVEGIRVGDTFSQLQQTLDRTPVDFPMAEITCRADEKNNETDCWLSTSALRYQFAGVTKEGRPVPTERVFRITAGIPLGDPYYRCEESPLTFHSSAKAQLDTTTALSNYSIDSDSLIAGGLHSTNWATLAMARRGLHTRSAGIQVVKSNCDDDQLWIDNQLVAKLEDCDAFCNAKITTPLLPTIDGIRVGDSFATMKEKLHDAVNLSHHKTKLKCATAPKRTVNPASEKRLPAMLTCHDKYYPDLQYFFARNGARPRPAATDRIVMIRAMPWKQYRE